MTISNGVTDIDGDVLIRIVAVSAAAITYAGAEPTYCSQILGRAQDFEDYIRGAEVQP